MCALLYKIDLRTNIAHSSREACYNLVVCRYFFFSSFSLLQLCTAWEVFMWVQTAAAIVKYSSFNSVCKLPSWLCRRAWRLGCLCSGNLEIRTWFFRFFPQCNHSFPGLNIVEFEKNFPCCYRAAALSPTFSGSLWDLLSGLHTKNTRYDVHFLSQQCCECGECISGSTCRPSLVAEGKRHRTY